MLSVILIVLKIQSATEITKCSDNCQSTFQYFNHGCSKSFHSQSGSFFRAFTLTSTYFQLSRAYKYLLLLASFKTFNCCLLTFCSIFKLSGLSFYSPERTKNGCRVSPLLLNSLVAYNLAKWILL
jgi:hypothetical protein